MTFFVTHRLGHMDNELPPEAFDSLLDELAAAPDDKEHADIAITTESGWNLGVKLEAGGTYRVWWENVEEAAAPPAVHMENLTRRETLRIMTLLADGAIDAVAALNWLPGY